MKDYISINKNYIYLGIGIFIVSIIGLFLYPSITGKSINNIDVNSLYKEFLCPCCGQTIDANCCEMAQERKEYVNSLVSQGLNENEVIVEMVKRYGIDSLKNDSKKIEVKEYMEKNAPKDAPKIEIKNKVYDFGEVSQSEGVVSTLIEIKNNGKSDLIINKMESSCMCTTASIIYNSVEGPIFGMSMHGENPTNWNVAIKPGEIAYLKVYYDPSVHGDLRGKVIRTIDIFSNDPINFQEMVRIELTQVE